MTPVVPIGRSTLPPESNWTRRPGFFGSRVHIAWARRDESDILGTILNMVSNVSVCIF